MCTPHVNKHKGRLSKASKIGLDRKKGVTSAYQKGVEEWEGQKNHWQKSIGDDLHKHCGQEVSRQ